MSGRTRIPTALTIAGSDSGGGAGIQADLKTFAALGVHGTTAVTCLTAQNPRGVRAIQACRPDIVRSQIEAVFAELPPAAVKTGMLYSSAIIRVVGQWFRKHRRTPLIIDPVMVATSGAPLLKPSALRTIRNDLLPRAELVTPNLREAEILLGHPIDSVEDQRRAAREICSQFGCAALVKGGHWAGAVEAVDFFFDGRTELLLISPFIHGVSTHGTGCTLSAAIAGYRARGDSLVKAITRAKAYISRAISGGHRVGRHDVLNHAAIPAPASVRKAPHPRRRSGRS